MLKGERIKISALATKDPIPADAKIERLIHSAKEGMLYIELSSDSFPEVHEDAEAPFLQTTFQAV
jgi:hypothetical protein